MHSTNKFDGSVEVLGALPISLTGI